MVILRYRPPPSTTLSKLNFHRGRVITITVGSLVYVAAVKEIIQALVEVSAHRLCTFLPPSTGVNVDGRNETADTIFPVDRLSKKRTLVESNETLEMTKEGELAITPAQGLRRWRARGRQGRRNVDLQEKEEEGI